jgi:hypothetical protein
MIVRKTVDGRIEAVEVRCDEDHEQLCVATSEANRRKSEDPNFDYYGWLIPMIEAI